MEATERAVDNSVSESCVLQGIKCEMSSESLEPAGNIENPGGRGRSEQNEEWETSIATSATETKGRHQCRIADNDPSRRLTIRQCQPTRVLVLYEILPIREDRRKVFHSIYYLENGDKTMYRNSRLS